MRKIMSQAKEAVLQSSKVYRIGVISNITLEPYFLPFVRLRFAERDVSVQLHVVRFENYLAETNVIADSDLVVIMLNWESQYPGWHDELVVQKYTSNDFCERVCLQCRNIYEVVKSNTNSPIVWFGYECDDNPIINICGAHSFPIDIIDAVNMKISAMLQGDDVHIDMRRLIARVGVDNAYDHKSKYRWNAPYTEQVISVVSDEIYKYYLILSGISKKCLVLDCDGVLWGGTLSEDGIEGVRLGNEGLGRSYQDFQRFLLALYYRGVILTVCSKNDKDDVMRVFREHSGMLLREEHIAYWSVNWDNKPNNICQIAESLNIGLDSMVFIDDSAFEVEAVRSLLPNVTAIYFERTNIYSQLSCFNLKSSIDIVQVHQRNVAYQTNLRRDELRKTSENFDGYLQELNMVVDVHIATLGEYARIAELSQRANQCTSGKRYTIAELIEQYSESDSRLYSVYLSDKFSDLGLVGAIGIQASVMKLFVLSCRAMGRNIEQKMLDVVLNSGVTQFEFTMTARNDKTYQLLEQCFRGRD